MKFNLLDILRGEPIQCEAKIHTKADNPLQKYAFSIYFNSIKETLQFQKVSGLSKEFGVTEYSEGNYSSVRKFPGRAKVGEVTAEVGMYKGDKTLFDMFMNSATEDYKQGVTINQYDRSGNLITKYRLTNAWISKWEGTDFDASSEDVAIEKITIQCDDFTIVHSTDSNF